MSDFIAFATYPDREQSILLVALLKQAGIEYQVEEEGSSLVSLASGLPQLDRIIIKIKEADFEKANELLDKEEASINVDHYLYTFSDEDLLDVLKNPGDWTQEELEIANKIVNERGISNKQSKENPPSLLESQVGESKVENSSEDKKEVTIDTIVMAAGVCSIIFIILIKLNIGFFTYITFAFMSTTAFYISQQYGDLMGILFSLFILVLAIFINLKHKWAVLFALIIFMYDTYFYFDYFDTDDAWFFGLLRGGGCIVLIKELITPTIDEDPKQTTK